MWVSDISRICDGIPPVQDRVLFNTRSEGVTDPCFWKKLFLEHRCIVPASLFFEWQQVAKKGHAKPKYEFVVPGREYFGFAGIWSHFFNPKIGLKEKTFSLLTQGANGVMLPVHERQPVVLEPRDYAAWLIETERPPVHLMRELPDEELTAKLLNTPHKSPCRHLWSEVKHTGIV